LVRVTGKKIEWKLASSLEFEWMPWCKSYTISKGVLTFDGRSSDMSYKKDASSGGGSTKTTQEELSGMWTANKSDNIFTQIIFDFDENKCYFQMGDEHYGVSIRVTGKRIEFHNSKTGWCTICESYNRLKGVLTFIGGDFDGNSFKR